MNTCNCKLIHLTCTNKYNINRFCWVTKCNSCSYIKSGASLDNKTNKLESNCSKCNLTFCADCDGKYGTCKDCENL